MKNYLWLLFIVLPFWIFAKDQVNYGEIKISKVVSVYDGCTFKVNIDEYPSIIGQNITVKIANIYTPEITSNNPEMKQKAQQAKIFTKNHLVSGKVILLKNLKRDKYFRLVADVVIDNESLGSELLKNKLAQTLSAKKSEKWFIINEK